MILLVAIYITSALLLTLYAAGTLILLVAYWRRRNHHHAAPTVTDLPRVGVQLPLYNEKHVVQRLLHAVAALDYPRDRLVIQILDDSTDDTTAVIAEIIEPLKRRGLHIDHLCRRERTGYKAGALAEGLTHLDVAFVAVFDADFAPPPDFLHQTIPHLVADQHVGVVQTRWTHLNPFDNALTRAQMLALDGHFVVEQTGRNRAGWLMNFSGSGGVWRVAAITDAGGWHADTLTEDLDLSYRAQLRGWRCLYLPDVTVPAELPPQMGAYKQQQARWAQGGTQCLRRFLPLIWRDGDLSLMQRIMATLHLAQYMNAPLIVTLLLLLPPLLVTGAIHDIPLHALSPLGLLGLSPPLLFLVSLWRLYPDWTRRLPVLPLLMVIATGMTWNNTRAVIAGLRGGGGEFRRTPKFARQTVNGDNYASEIDRSVWVEFGLMLYALWGVWLALSNAPALTPYLALYALGYGTVALLGLRDALHTVNVPGLSLRTRRRADT